MARPPMTPMTIPAMTPPDIDDDDSTVLADPEVCADPPVVVPLGVPLDDDVVATAPDRQDKSLPATTLNMLLLAAVLGLLLSHPAM